MSRRTSGRGSRPQPAGLARGCRIAQACRVPMRDGVLLAADVYLPADSDGPFPVMLVRTAYGRRLIDEQVLPQQWVDRGFAVVAQDVRGRWDSEGTFYPFVHEASDGVDTLDWIADQPWCNGSIGMTGNSYLAAVQWYVAPEQHPALRSLNPRFMAGDVWQNGYYCNGAFSFALTFSWLCLEVSQRTSAAGMLPMFDVSALLRRLPLIDMDKRLGIAPAAIYRDFAARETRDGFWQSLDVRPAMNRFRVPVLLTAGWYDYYPGETFKNYAALVAAAPTPDLAAQHRLIVGPWTHGIHGGSALGEIDFGPAAVQEADHSLRWHEALLQAGDVNRFSAAPIRLFVMGRNQWRDEQEWPLKRTRWTRFYLRSGGCAADAPEDGRLDVAAPPAGEPADRYIYDPDDPVPTLGGNHSVGPYNPGLYELCLPGPYDQRSVERRRDVLVYTTATLERDTEVTGPVAVTLWIASTAPDTDFVARLTDVHPDGRSMNLTEGILRVRYRDRQWAEPTPMEPGTVYRIEIELQPTSHVFFAGHRIRLAVTSSCFPLWDRNLNTGESSTGGTRVQTARQTIYHDGERPSHLLLPVIPG